MAHTIFAIPPFPGAKPFDHIRSGSGATQRARPTLLLEEMRRLKVGGPFWLEHMAPTAREAPQPVDSPMRYSAADPKALLAAIGGQKVLLNGKGPFEALSGMEPGAPEMDSTLHDLIDRFLLADVSYCSPFTGEPISALELVAIIGEWRALIEANRSIAGAFGFALWKRETIDPLLWAGKPVPFLAPSPEALATIPEQATIAVWKARVPAPFLATLEAGPWRLLEVEDGFIRSAGLGADCIPPLSIVADDLGVHYDPTRPNRLEEMLACHDFSTEELVRAGRLRDWIVQGGISKYGVGKAAPLLRAGRARQHLLVIGQVEDDRSVQFGGGEVRSNLELLKRVRANAPDAWIVYRPHPDVQAGHRRGSIPQRLAFNLADAVEPASPIGALIAMVDEVHVITSLAGFEALLQGKPVTAHGTPFYAGWGLTTDLGPPMPRRGRSRSLDDLVAAVLLRYPRYLDPVTNLPCSAEMLVMRLISGVQRQNFALVPMRRLVGWARRASAQILGLR
ncbi:MULTISPECIES: capsule biosynthesis protein [unclassified Sphingobium]|uniref:capsular polysaccharide export protein, LipB/KpsS family n=1 Tax=unclassified Sphingobium TaxID=2611147 RepID=UPI0022241393|nr:MULTISPECIES: capsule biosynthesis protein [unclassified Sphingobium]MCW2384952.1 capsular polysaccharide export protein [Sphingobium sp. B2D3D]